VDVDDLAAAHLSALDYLLQTDTSTKMKCGYGHGFSVKEVERITTCSVVYDDYEPKK
jgi:UDP-glucose 4-epimerase